MSTEFDKFVKQQQYQATKPNLSELFFNTPEVKIPNTRNQKKFSKKDLDELKQKLNNKHSNISKIIKPLFEQRKDGGIKLAIKKKYVFMVIAVLLLINPFLIIYVFIFWLAFSKFNKLNRS